MFGRQTTIHLALAAVGCLLFAAAQAADGNRHAAARGRFEQLKKNAAIVPGAKAPRYTTTKFDIGGDPIEIATGECTIEPVSPLDPDHAPYHLGIQVWFQLADGRYVNPVKHKWQRRERFWIWVESAVPLQVALFQNYPDDQPRSRQVYPDVRYPATFHTLFPGHSKRLPVMFVMDDDLRDELMSMVVVRSDSGCLPLNDSMSSGDSGTSGPGGVIKGRIDPTVTKFTKLNDEAMAKGTILGQSAKFDIAGPEESGPIFAQQPHDVAFFFLGPGKMGQFQMTLHKD